MDSSYVKDLALNEWRQYQLKHTHSNKQTNSEMVVARRRGKIFSGPHEIRSFPKLYACLACDLVLCRNARRGNMQLKSGKGCGSVTVTKYNSSWPGGREKQVKTSE